MSTPSPDRPLDAPVVIPPPPPRLADYLRDACGDPSTMRLMMALAVVAGIGFGVLAVAFNSHIALSLAFGLWGVAFPSKVAQSFAERGDCR